MQGNIHGMYVLIRLRNYLKLVNKIINTIPQFPAYVTPKALTSN